jgi:hypothetical protein
MERKRPLIVKLAAGYLALYGALRVVDLGSAFGETITAFMYGNRRALALPLVRIVVAAVAVGVLMEGKRYGHALGLVVLALAVADRAAAAIVRVPMKLPDHPNPVEGLGMSNENLIWNAALVAFWLTFAFSSATRAYFRPRAVPLSETKLESIFE